MAGRAPLFAALVLLSAFAHPAHAQPFAGENWVGKRVVTHFGTVLIDNRPGGKVDDEERSRELNVSGRDRRSFRIYRVQHVNGNWLWLRAEKDPVEGWADAARVIPFEQAIDHITGLIRANPSDASNYEWRGHVWSAQLQKDLAFADYDQAVRLDPGEARYYMSRGSAWASKGDYDKAIDDLTQAIRLDPRFVSAYHNRGYKWMVKREYDKAIADFTEAIKLDPTDSQSFTDRGFMRSLKGERDKAIADFTEAIRLDPRDTFAFHERGQAWLAKKEYEKALADFTEEIRLDTVGVMGYIYRAKVWSVKAEHDKAIADYDQAIQIKPGEPDVIGRRGMVWYAKKDYDRAIADYDQAIRISPILSWIWNERGNAWYAKGEHDRAIADYSESIRLAPGDAVVYDNRGRVWLDKNEYRNALADFDNVIRISPHWSKGYTYRAWLRATCRDSTIRNGNAAVEDATKACELTKWKGVAALDTCAAAYAERGDYGKAVEFQEKVVELLRGDATLEKARDRLTRYRAGKPYHEGEGTTVIATNLPPGPNPPKEAMPGAAVLKSTRIYLPKSEIEVRLGTDPKPMGDYYNALMARLNALLAQAEKPAARGLLVAIGLKEGRRTKVWCQQVEGDVAAALLRTIEAELTEVPAPELRKGPAGFAMEIELFGRKPAMFPESPDRWRDAAEVSRSKKIVPPDDLFRIVWPD